MLFLAALRDLSADSNLKEFINAKYLQNNNVSGDREKWDAASIRERTKWLIDYLLQEVLPIPEKMRRTNNFNTKDVKGLSFQNLQLIGLDINFIADPTIIAHVVGDKQVEFEGKKWRLSPLTREIQTRRGTVNKSDAYQGAQYWEYDGIKLADIM